MTSNTVRFDIEFGDLEIEYEGPTDFARDDFLSLVKGLVEVLVEAGPDDEDDEDDEGEDDAEDDDRDDKEDENEDEDEDEDERNGALQAPIVPSDRETSPLSAAPSLIDQPTR